MTPDEAATVEAIAARLVPSDDLGPGAAEAGVAVFIDRALAEFYRAHQDDYRRGLRALDDLARARFARPFSALKALEQDTLLGEQEGQPFFELIRQHVLGGLFADPLYGGNRDFVGWRLVNFPGAVGSYTADEMQAGRPLEREFKSVADWERPKLPLPLGEGRGEGGPLPSGRVERPDALIVGLGAAGGVLAKELAGAGMKVVALERGLMLDPRELHTMDELRMTALGGLRANANQLVTRRLDDGSPTYLEDDQASGVGGATIHWAGMVWRFDQDDFRVRSATLERYGEAALPPDNLIEDWPISYADLEPYYEQAEVELGVSGVWAEGGGNPFEPPRRRDYPLPPLRDSAASRTFCEGARALGLHPFPTPAAILSEDYRGPLGLPRRACQYCGFCRNHGCVVDAKASSLWTLVPVAQATGNLEIRTGCRAVRINLDADGKRARSVAYYDRDGTLQEQEAGLIFVAAGAVAETIRLLLLSTSERYPGGLGSSSGWLGRGFMAHPRPSIIALYDDRVLNAHIGPNHVKACVDDFNADHFDHQGLGFIRGGVIFCDVNGSGGPMSFSDSVPPGLPRWGSAYKAYLARYFSHHLSIGAWLENLPNEHAYLDLDQDVKDRFGLPVARITSRRQPNDDRMLAFMLERLQVIARASGASKYWVRVGDPQPAGHESGGARMGAEPANSVTNRWGQLWDAPNVFVSSSALYPTQSGYNSTLTIFAMAYRQGAYVRREALAGGELARYLSAAESRH